MDGCRRTFLEEEVDLCYGIEGCSWRGERASHLSSQSNFSAMSEVGWNLLEVSREPWKV
jgi:hypothetical protein